MGRLDEAEHLMAKAHAMDPEVPIYRTMYAQILTSQGREDEAIEQLAPFEKAPASHAWSILGLILKRALERDVAGVEGLVTEKLSEAFRHDQMYAYLMGERYALLDDKERALEWLEVAIEGGFWNSGFMMSDPLFRDLRGEPEFRRLVEIAREKTKQFERSGIP